MIGEGVDLLFANDVEAKEWAGKETVEESMEEIKKIAKQIVITRALKAPCCLMARIPSASQRIQSRPWTLTVPAICLQALSYMLFLLVMILKRQAILPVLLRQPLSATSALACQRKNTRKSKNRLSSNLSLIIGT